jgi:hypothetical protein
LAEHDDVLVDFAKDNAQLVGTYLRSKSTVHDNLTQDDFEFRNKQLEQLADHILAKMRRVFKLGNKKIHATRTRALQSTCNFIIAMFVKSKKENFSPVHEDEILISSE